MTVSKLLFYMQFRDKLYILIVIGLHNEMNDVLRLFQNMKNNLEVVQCTLLSKQISLGLLYLKKCWAICNNGVNVFLWI